MFEVIKFIFNLVGQFLRMLFNVDIGPMSLGLFMCIVFLFFPIVLSFVNFLKSNLFSEFDERRDELRLIRKRGGKK